MTATLPTDTTNKEWFAAQFKLYEAGLNGHADHPFANFRKAGFAEFEGIHFPTRRDEDWKYTSVGRILNETYRTVAAPQISAADIEPFRISNLDAIQLVFVNGKLDSGLSQMDNLPAGLTIQKVSEAIQEEATRNWMEIQVGQKGGTKANPFLPMNRAFATDGIFIKTEKNAQIERPVHLIYMTTGEGSLVHPQMFVHAQPGSFVAVIEGYQAGAETGAYFNNAATWVDVEANAEVSHYRLQNEGRAGFQINNAIVRQGRDSRYNNFAIDLGGRIVRNNLSTEHLGSNVETHYLCAFLGNGAQHIDNQTFIDHAVPHCESNELYKGVLAGKSRGVFNGKVLVRQDAQKTNAYQQNSCLVLSPNAVMDAKPELEIYADDVKCSHGAAIGQMDEKSVFYLRSRGIPEAQAKHLLQRAFVLEVLEQFKNETIREHAQRMVDAKLGQG